MDHRTIDFGHGRCLHELSEEKDLAGVGYALATEMGGEKTGRERKRGSVLVFAIASDLYDFFFALEYLNVASIINFFIERLLLAFI